MDHIRIKISVHLNQNHALSEKDLKSFKPAIKRAVAGSLPASVNVDTVEVTRIKEAKKDRKLSGAQAEVHARQRKADGDAPCVVNTR